LRHKDAVRGKLIGPVKVISFFSFRGLAALKLYSLRVEVSQGLRATPYDGVTPYEPTYTCNAVGNVMSLTGQEHNVSTFPHPYKMAKFRPAEMPSHESNMEAVKEWISVLFWPGRRNEIPVLLPRSGYHAFITCRATSTWIISHRLIELLWDAVERPVTMQRAQYRTVLKSYSPNIIACQVMKRLSARIKTFGETSAQRSRVDGKGAPGGGTGTNILYRMFY
jgi:hypothetical protein